MDLNHSFTVPASVADTWKTFEDIESVAACFPGATLTAVEGNDFRGTCKVKLGPIALVYSGAGTFLEKDEAARRFVVEAKGKDKRGNGTAGATVTATFAEDAPGFTRVDVQTDLAITGKPAQFGRGMIEDISSKLLQQFVTCLRDKVGVTEEPAETEPLLTPATTAVDASDAVPSAGDDASGAAELAASSGTATASAPEPGTTQASRPSPATSPATSPAPSPAVAPRASSSPSTERPTADDALDLGATVLPILARTYGPHAAIALVALVIGYRLGRRRG